MCYQSRHHYKRVAQNYLEPAPRRAANYEFFDSFRYLRLKCILTQQNEVLILSTVLEPISAKNEEAAVEAFGNALRAGRPHAKLINPGGKEIPIPAAIYKVLDQVIPLLISDNAVSIVPVSTLLTTQEAADLLNVSRPYLIKLLEQGAIKFERSKDPGSHRKIRFVDLMEYKHKIDLERREQIRKLTKMSQEAGLYDE